MSFQAATPTFTIIPSGSSFRAMATFPHGVFAARRPVVGPAAAAPSDAIKALLASADLAYALSSAMTPRVYADDLD